MAHTSSVSRIGNLPLELTSFVGRRRELAEAKKLLATSRLVTLSGVGGVGKTRLALRVSAEVRRAFGDGVWLVDLGQLRDPMLVAHSVAGVLGLRDQSGRSPLDALREYLASRRLLLVLDNCEHVIESCAEVAEALLRSTPGLHILATSREPLAVPGEMVLPVPSLPVPDPEKPSSVRELPRYDAARLFADRAAAALNGFAFTDDNREAVARICHDLEGLPLAIELAAARLRALSAEQIAQRLSDRYRLLIGGLRGVPLRHQTLRSCIEWSHDLCSPKDKLLWARVSVFAGDFGLDAAEAVCAGDGLPVKQVLGHVSSLVDKSVLIRDHRGRNARYRLLETIREFGCERLEESGEYATVRRRHRDWYERLVSQADADWLSSRQVDWFSRLDSEHANIQAAVDFCLTEPGEAESGLRILTGLFHFYWWGRGWAREGRHWLDQALKLATEPTPSRARALLTDASLALADGEFETGRRRSAEARAIADAHDDPGLTALVGWISGSAAMYRGDLPGAIADFESGLSVLPSDTDLPLRLDLLLSYSVAAGVAGDEKRAIACHEATLKLTEPVGECFHRSYALWALGLLALNQGEHRRAAELQQESLRLRRGLRDLTGAGWSLESLAWAEGTAARHARAATLLGAADQLWEVMGRPLRTYQHLIGNHDACDREARRALGKARFDVAFQRGRGFDFEEAMAYALEEDLESTPATEAEVETPLTRRERQVAELVAEGLTNREIAARLVISTRTVESHVEKILSKLGFSSRARVAAWIAAHPQALERR